MATAGLQTSRLKAWCLWAGPDRHIRLRSATIREDGLANVRRGPKAVKVIPSRTLRYRGRPCFIVVGNNAEVHDLAGSDHERLVTASEFDEMANNNYAQQVMAELGQNLLAKVRDWLVIGGMILILGIQIYFHVRTTQQLEGVAEALQTIGVNTPPGPESGAVPK